MPKDDRSVMIGENYPQLSTAEQHEVEENLRQYLAVVKRIFENVRIEKPEILTELRRRANVRKSNEQKALR
jgi:hypothetical protein